MESFYQFSDYEQKHRLSLAINSLDDLEHLKNLLNIAEQELQQTGLTVVSIPAIGITGEQLQVDVEQAWKTVESIAF